MFGLITKREHDEIVAAKDAEIENLSTLCDTLVAECEQYEARLAVFTAPRPRGPGGRFLPTRPLGEMVEGGL